MQHPPRFLLLYGSLRERSFSRLAVEEAERMAPDTEPVRPATTSWSRATSGGFRSWRESRRDAGRHWEQVCCENAEARERRAGGPRWRRM